MYFLQFRWGSDEIIKARTLIHKYYIDVANNQEKDGIPKTKEGIHFAIGAKILKLHGSTEGDDPMNFIYLLNFIDFMETIGYFYVNNFVELKAIENLCGLSVIFNYEIFKQVIEHKRTLHHPKFYEDFEKLYKALTDNC